MLELFVHWWICYFILCSRRIQKFIHYYFTCINVNYFSLISVQTLTAIQTCECLIWIWMANTTIKCSYSEFFWSIFSHIWSEYGEIRSISPYSIRMRENTGQNSSEYGHFSRSGNSCCSGISSPFLRYLLYSLFIHSCQLHSFYYH